MTSLNSTTLRPGLLVALKTSIAGNVNTRRSELVAAHTTEAGTRKRKWETETEVLDPAEYERGTTARSKARSVISGVCAKTAFGYLCPETAADNLEKAMKEARKIVDDFNATAAVTRVYFYAITGRVAPDDVEAVKAINSEIRTLLAEMTAGVENLDVKAIRKAADEARQLGQMLTPDAQARIQIAIDAARKTATKLNAAGETAAKEIDRQTISTLTEARTAFLDLDDAREVAAPVTHGRAVDFAAGSGAKSASPTTPARQMDF